MPLPAWVEAHSAAPVMESAKRLVRAIARGTFPHELSWLIDNPLRRVFLTPERLASRLELRTDSRILEVGPGSGYFSAELARRVPRGRLELFDLQPEMLAKAKRKLDAQAFSNIGYSAGNAALPFPYSASSFDVAVLVTVLGEVPDSHACVEGVRRVLVDGGLLAVHEHWPDPDFVSFEFICSIASGHGFVFEGRWGSRWNFTAHFRKAD